MATEIIFANKSWWLSDHNVQNMMRATLVQCGLVPNRIDIGITNLCVYGCDNKELSLFDRINPLFDEVKRCVDNDIKSAIKVRALAKLVQIHFMFQSEEYNKEQVTNIDFNDVHPSLLACYFNDKRKHINTIATEAYDYIHQKCADWLSPNDLKHLDPTYQQAANVLRQGKSLDNRLKLPPQQIIRRP
jgi:hypothetical protein